MAACAFAVAGIWGQARANSPVYLLRISSENTERHIQTRIIQHFVDNLSQRAGERLKIEYYHSARLFRDRDVIGAMIDGKVEMAVPGSWQLDRFEPNFALFMLPAFYGRDADIFHRLADGDVGKQLNSQLEHSVDVKVLGRWIDLGHANLYFTDVSVRSYKDLAGIPIRVAGSDANIARLEAFGANPRVISWPDLPYALENGQVQGTLSTHETVDSAHLWKNNIRFAFEDREYFAQYLPVISSDFWDRLPDDLQRQVQQAWEDGVDRARAEAQLAQTEARASLLQHGIDIITPNPQEIRNARYVAMAAQKKLVDKLGINQRLLEQATAELQP